MSVLVILLPARARGSAGADAPADYAFVLSSDGQAVSRQGQASARQLPRADSVCAVVADADLAWHRITLPKAPTARLRAALGAVLEEQLLEEDEDVHLAVEPGLAGGQTGWVVATHKTWLSSLLADLERAGVALDRVLPLSWPGPTPCVHALPAAVEAAEPTGVFSHADGVACLGLGGSLARQQLAALDRASLVCSAHPAAVAAAERWLEAPVKVLSDAERALQATRSTWNLRQFDLAPRHRGLLALRTTLRRVGGPSWRPVRLGLAAFVLLQLVGLNVWAWRLDQALLDKRQAMSRLLLSTHPQVRSVLDAPLQMQAETERLRAAAGRPGPLDLEPLLALAASAWPEGQPPLQALRFEPGRLTLATVGWGEPQHAAFAERVRAAGYRVEAQGAQVVVSRGGRS
jgi:general secretion pathway protein L